MEVLSAFMLPLEGEWNKWLDLQAIYYDECQWGIKWEGTVVSDEGVSSAWKSDTQWRRERWRDWVRKTQIRPVTGLGSCVTGSL
jgi:hypothetical protein